MAKDSGYIDLGKSYDTSAKIAEDPKNKVSYPSVYITHDMEGEGAGMDEVPDEGEATIKYRIVSYKEDLKNGTCSCEIEIMGFKPSATKAKKQKSSDDSLDEALTNIENSKK